MIEIGGRNGRSLVLQSRRFFPVKFVFLGEAENSLHVDGDKVLVNAIVGYLQFAKREQVKKIEPAGISRCLWINFRRYIKTIRWSSHSSRLNNLITASASKWGPVSGNKRLVDHT